MFLARNEDIHGRVVGALGVSLGLAPQEAEKRVAGVASFVEGFSNILRPGGRPLSRWTLRTVRDWRDDAARIYPRSAKQVEGLVPPHLSSLTRKGIGLNVCSEDIRLSLEWMKGFAAPGAPPIVEFVVEYARGAASERAVRVVFPEMVYRSFWSQQGESELSRAIGFIEGAVKIVVRAELLGISSGTINDLKEIIVKGYVPEYDFSTFFGARRYQVSALAPHMENILRDDPRHILDSTLSPARP